MPWEWLCFGCSLQLHQPSLGSEHYVEVNVGGEVFLIAQVEK